VRGVGVVALGELDEGFGGDGAFEMKVELGFGEAAEPGFGVGLIGLVGLGNLSGACHLTSLCAQGCLAYAFRREPEWTLMAEPSASRTLETHWSDRKAKHGP